MPKVCKVGKFRQAAAASKAASIAARAATKMEVESLEKKKPVDYLRAAMKNPKTVDATSKNPTSLTATADEQKETALSRGQRKRQAKREQYMRKEKMILSTLQLKKADEQKKRIDGLDALKNALLETIQEKTQDPTIPTSTKKESNLITTNKAKQRIVGPEIHRMELVVQHPAFQEDPFAAIRVHLENTLAEQEKANDKEAVQHTKERQQAKEKRKLERKERLQNVTKKKSKKSKFKATRQKSRK